jgi:hypothetical protein
MDLSNVKERTFGQKSTCRKEGDYWRIHVITTETLTYDDGTVKEDSIESECLDMDFDTAHQIALSSVLSELRALVYERNFDSLVLAKEYQRKLEAENADGSQTHEDTPTQ